MEDTGADVSIYDAKTHLSRLVHAVEAGGTVTISRHGTPVARLVPYAPEPPRRTPGVLRGQISMAADFDAFTADDARVWYGP